MLRGKDGVSTRLYPCQHKVYGCPEALCVTQWDHEYKQARVGRNDHRRRGEGCGNDRPHLARPLPASSTAPPSASRHGAQAFMHTPPPNTSQSSCSRRTSGISARLSVSQSSKTERDGAETEGTFYIIYEKCIEKCQMMVTPPSDRERYRAICLRGSRS